MPAKRKASKKTKNRASKKAPEIVMHGLGRMIRMKHPQLGMGYMSMDGKGFLQDGGSFWSDLGNGFKSAGNYLYNNVAKPVVSAVAPALLNKGINYLTSKITGSGMQTMPHMTVM